MGTHGGPAITAVTGARNLRSHLLWKYDINSKKGRSGDNLINLANRSQTIFTMQNSNMYSGSEAREERLYFDGSGIRTGNYGNSYHLNYNSSIAFSNYRTIDTDHSDGYTLLWWMKPDGRASHQNDGSGYGLWVGSGTIAHIELRGLNYTTNNSAYFRTEAAQQNGYSFGTSTIPGGVPNGEFTHFAIAFENEGTRTVKWYKNGELFHTHANMESGNGANEHFYFYRIGSNTGHPSYYYAGSFKGWMPEAAAYSTNLTAKEIKRIYKRKKTRYQ